MVQVFKTQRKPSVGQRFAQAFGSLGQAIPEFLMEKEKAAKEKEKAEKQKKFYQEMGIPEEISALSPEERKAILPELLKGKQKKEKFEYLISKSGNGEKEGADNYLQRLFNQPENVTDFQISQVKMIDKDIGNQLETARDTAIKGQEKHQERLREKEAVKNVLLESGMDPEEAEIKSETYDLPTARALLKPKIEKAPYEATSAKLSAERTQSYIDNVIEKGNTAEEQIRNLDTGMALHQSGATGFKLSNWLADYFKVPALADPKSKAFNALMKKEYEGIARTVGGKVSNFEMGIFQGRIAQAEDSPKAAEGLMIASRMQKLIDLKERDIVNQLREEYFEKGEDPPSNFDLIVRNRLRPYADLIMAQTNEDLKNLLNPTTPTEAKGGKIRVKDKKTGKTGTITPYEGMESKYDILK